MCIRFSQFQRAHIPQSIMDVLLGNKRPHLEEYDIKMEAVSANLVIRIHQFCCTRI